ncbi:MAG TPA: hypothetical protein VIK72_08010 [Clostridiaceae bacterium]
MNKKKIIALALTAILLMPTVTFAKGNPVDAGKSKERVTVQSKTFTASKVSDKINVNDKAKDNDKVKDNNIDKAKVKEPVNVALTAEKKAQLEAFKVALNAKHITMTTLRTETLALKKEIRAKADNLRAISKDIKAGKKVLTAEQLTQLLALSDIIKQDSVNLKATGCINAKVAETQDKVNKRDFSNALTSLDKVIANLQARLVSLNKLNVDLDAALAITNLATAPTTPVVTDGTTSK